MDNYKLKVRKLLLISPDNYRRLQKSNNTFPSNLLGFKKKFSKISQNDKLSDTEKLNHYNTLFTMEHNPKNLRTHFRNKQDTGMQSESVKTSNSSQTNNTKKQDGSTSPADDAYFSPEAASSANVSRNVKFQPPQQTPPGRLSVDHFFNPNLYSNLPLKDTNENESQHEPDMSAAFKEFVENIRKESGNDNVDLRDYSIGDMNNSKDYVVMRDKNAETVLTVDKPNIGVKPRESSSPLRTRSGKARKPHIPKNNRNRQNDASNSGNTVWRSYEDHVRRKLNKRNT